VLCSPDPRPVTYPRPEIRGGVPPIPRCPKGTGGGCGTSSPLRRIKTHRWTLKPSAGSSYAILLASPCPRRPPSFPDPGGGRGTGKGCIPCYTREDVEAERACSALSYPGFSPKGRGFPQRSCQAPSAPGAIYGGKACKQPFGLLR
jgi:hypothetical protein